MSPAESYRQIIERLAGQQAALAAEQAEARRWYAQQDAAAQAAVGRAAEVVAEASGKVEAMRSAVERVDMESHRLWRLLEDRVGTLGGPPRPAPVTDPGDDPFLLLQGVEDSLARAAKTSRVLPSWAAPLLVVVGAAGAGLGLAAAYGARWVAHRIGGDFDTFAPVLKQIVTLLAPFVGLAATKLVADRRDAQLDAGAVGVVVVSGLLTLGALLILVGP